MTKKTLYSKKDIARWIAILPVTALAIIFYAEVVNVWLYKVFLMYFDGEIDGHIFSYVNAFMFAIIISLLGYFISPQLRFKSTLITISSFAILFALFFINNIYAKEMINSFVIIYSLTSLLILLVIYRLEGK